jgi:hypothetical protein
MNVFLSWSGDRSRAVADALSELLPIILQAARPWVSNHDIAPGSRWGIELSRELEGTNFGVLCLTAENLGAPWLLFEAGSLSKQLHDSRVVPYRLDLRTAEIPFPLAQFQGVDANQSGTRKLIETLNAALPEPVERGRLDRIFEWWWPDMKGRVEQAARIPVEVPRTRSDRDLMEETLALVRGLQKTSLGRLPAADGILRFAEYPDNVLGPNLRSAGEIALSGLNMFRFLPMFWTDIEEALKNGAKLRILLADPESSAVEMASFRSESRLTQDIERKRILGSIEFLKHQIGLHATADIQLKVSSYLPPYSIAVLRPRDPQLKAYCHARILPFRRTSLRAPVIIPDPDTDSAWFGFIQGQFEEMWDAASPVGATCRPAQGTAASLET